MHKLSTFSAAAVLLALTEVPAAAQTVNKTWVSSTGTDSGSCQLVAPCKTFAYAISETNAGGEIDVKDSGAYGAFTINKAVTIVADGVAASVGVGPNGYGIAIQADTYDLIAIRGLTINTHNLDSGADIYVNCVCDVVLDHDLLQGSHVGLTLAQNATVTVTNTLVSGNYIGVSRTTGTVFLGYDTIAANKFGLSGNFNSYGNNSISSNSVCDYMICATITKVSPE